MNQLDKKYQILKKRLDALNYNFPFNEFSTSLVEKLLNDLIKTTENLQSLKNSIKDSNFTEKNEFLKFENNKLISENNLIHFEIIKIKENNDI